jgi:hypothetical protein
MADTWKCFQCGCRNLGKAWRCDRCQKPKDWDKLYANRRRKRP